MKIPPLSASALFAVIMAVIMAVLAAGCSPPVRPPVDPDAESRPAEAMKEPPEVEGRRFRVDPEQSEIRIVVFPDGPLARLGHPHVIGGPVLSGQVVVAEPFADSFVELAIDTAGLELDWPQWREAEGFEPEQDEQVIEDTRANLFGEDVLNVDEYPHIRIVGWEPTGARWHPDLRVHIELKGTLRELTVPVALQLDDDQLEASGRFRVRQTEFGIEPFSAAGGNLLVADDLIVRFRIRAVAE